MAKHDYEVGFKRPPTMTRFQKGKSGNPKGRPKGAKSISSILAKTGREIVPVTINGVVRKMTKTEAACTQLTNQAAGGDPKAIRDFFAIHRQFPEPDAAINTPTFSNERDEATLKSLLQRIRNTQPPSESESSQTSVPKETNDLRFDAQRIYSVFEKRFHDLYGKILP